MLIILMACTTVPASSTICSARLFVWEKKAFEGEGGSIIVFPLIQVPLSTGGEEVNQMAHRSDFSGRHHGLGSRYTNSGKRPYSGGVIGLLGLCTSMMCCACGSAAGEQPSPHESTSVAVSKQNRPVSETADDRRKADYPEREETGAKDDSFNVSVAFVKATKQHLDAAPERARAVAEESGVVAYLVWRSSQCPDAAGISPSRNLGIMVDVQEGFTDENIIANASFLKTIFEMARTYMDESLFARLLKSESHSVALVDERVTDPNAAFKDIIPDVIGVYRLTDGDVMFVPNPRYQYFSERGFMKLVPFIREKLNACAADAP